MKIQQLVSFAALEAQISLETASIAVSDEKALNAKKNIKNRLKEHKEFCKASENVLNLIVAYSDEKTLESLLEYKCYKTARRILELAKFLNDEKTSVNITSLARVLESSNKAQFNNVELCSKALSNTDLARMNKTIKAFMFFDILKIENKSFTDAIKQTDTIIKQ